MNNKNSVSNIKWSALGTVGLSAFQMLQIAILTRFLPKEAFGLIAMALFVVQFSNIFADLGMTSAILHKQNPTKEEYSSIYWLNITISIFLYLILILCTPFFSSFYEEPILFWLIPILGTNIFLMAIGRQHRTIMQKRFQFKSIALIELGSYFIGLIAAITFALLDFGVYSLVISTLLYSFFANCCFLLINIKVNPIIFYFNLKQTKPFLKIGGYSTGSTLLDFFSREFDVLIIGKVLGAGSLGVYSLSKQLVLKAYSILNPIVINFLNPMLSSLQNDKEKLKSYTLKTVYLLATLNFPIYLAMTFLSIEILQVFYGKEYVSGYLVLSFYAISYATHSINNPSGSLQIATGRTDIGLKWTIIRLLIVPWVIYSVSDFGINYISFTVALLNICFIVPIWWMQFRPLAKIRLREYLAQFIKPYLIFLGLSVFYIIISKEKVIEFGLLLNVIIKGTGAILLYLLLLRIFDRERCNSLFGLIHRLKFK